MQSDCKKIDDFLRGLGFSVYDKDLVLKALTHSSYTNDSGKSYLDCYERLEFLGDAVLKLITSEYLYKNFPEHHEGKLTQIRSVVVSDEVLAKVALKIGLSDFIRMSDAEAKDGGKEKTSILACAMEALFGAIYLSGGYKDVEKFVVNSMAVLIDDLNSNRSVYNAKAILQEYTQSESKELPVYNIVKEIGKSNNKTFFVEVRYKDEVLAQGKGKSKRSAQQDAAFSACKKLKLIEEE